MQKGPRPPRSIVEELLHVVAIQHLIALIPALGEPAQADATREGNVGVGVEDRVLRDRRFDRGVLVDQQEFR